jgi:hypothetical protein
VKREPFSDSEVLTLKLIVLRKHKVMVARDVKQLSGDRFQDVTFESYESLLIELQMFCNLNPQLGDKIIYFDLYIVPEFRVLPR